MDRSEAAGLARELMNQHGLADWHFEWSRARKALGDCTWSRKRIRLSVHFVDAGTLDQVRDTILHEVAHALAGPEAGHGPAWKAWCRRIGAKPERCASTGTVRVGYRAVCGCCGGVAGEWVGKPRRNFDRNWHRPCGRASLGQLRLEKVDHPAKKAAD